VLQGAVPPADALRMIPFARAALRGQAAAIVSHTSGSTPTFTLATGAWTTAPLTTDSFTVV
jgi:hypothetical protein